MTIDSKLIEIMSLIALLVLVVLVWQVFKWLKLIAVTLGCNPRRTRAIQNLTTQLKSTSITAEERKKLDEELDECYDNEMFEAPCKVGQGVRIIERLQDIIKLLENKPKA